MSSNRTTPAAHRATFRALPLREIDWRLVAPAARRTLDRLAFLSTLLQRLRTARVDSRALVITGVASSLATAAFFLAGFALFR